MVDKIPKSQSGLICIFFITLLLIEVLCSLHRFSNESKTKFLILENEKVNDKMFLALQGAGKLYEIIVQKRFPSIDDLRLTIQCFDHTDLSTVSKHHISDHILNMREPPSTAYVTIESQKIVVGDFTKASDDFTTAGTVVQMLMNVEEDQSDGLVWK